MNKLVELDRWLVEQVHDALLKEDRALSNSRDELAEHTRYKVLTQVRNKLREMV